ncbi:hypothetical protein SDC9_113013 [bioreactor metagenome]|uniref:Uncharacterized protein n=1 Tax=bioreactor metagenome TaxID=1076179 RepID=A0A645BLD9_9ZZZZ
MCNFFFRQFQTIYRDNGNVVLFRNGFCKLNAFFGLRVFTVEQNNEWLVEVFQFTDDAFLTLFVFITRNIADAAVCCHDKPDCGMFTDDLLSADFSCHIERYFLVEPWRFHHSRLVIFNISQRGGDNVTNTVYHSYFKMDIRI